MASPSLRLPDNAPGEFYVMGDNRQISCDSRYWGPIKGSSIIGKVALLFWHTTAIPTRTSSDCDRGAGGGSVTST